MNTSKIKSLLGKSAVLDNNIICDFIELDALDIINEIFSEIQIPTNILNDELILDGYREKLKHAFLYTPVTIQKSESYILFGEIQDKAPTLTDYDVEVIVIANENSVLCTSNEGKIMKVCSEYNIDYTGTIGIICCAYEHKIINENRFVTLLRKLFLETSCWISKNIKKQVITHYKLPIEPQNESSDIK